MANETEFSSLPWQEQGEGWWRAEHDAETSYHVDTIGSSWYGMRVVIREPQETQLLGYRDSRAKAIAVCEQDAAKRFEVAA